jgi:hypothetical protein
MVEFGYNNDKITGEFVFKTGGYMQQIRDGLLVPAAEPAKVDINKITKTFESGSKWFYAIAGLSIINSVTHLARSNFTFVVGLGVTQIIDGIAMGIGSDHPEASGVFNAIAFIFSAIFAGIFALFGWFAAKKHSWAFIVGMILYVLDGLIFLLVKDWLSLGFHGFACICILNAYLNMRKLNQLQAVAMQQQEEAVQVLTLQKAVTD